MAMLYSSSTSVTEIRRDINIYLQLREQGGNGRGGTEEEGDEDGDLSDIESDDSSNNSDLENDDDM
jgi:hypothetical protein